MFPYRDSYRILHLPDALELHCAVTWRTPAIDIFFGVPQTTPLERVSLILARIFLLCLAFHVVWPVLMLISLPRLCLLRMLIVSNISAVRVLVSPSLFYFRTSREQGFAHRWVLNSIFFIPN
jgi:hypothetical protein